MQRLQHEVIMESPVYSSNAEDAVLKATGPHRIFIAGASFSGMKGSSSVAVGRTYQAGNITTYAEVDEQPEESANAEG